MSLAFREITFDKSAMAQVIRDYRIDIRESRCRKALHDGLRRSAVLEGSDDEFQQNPGAADTHGTGIIVPKRRCVGSNL